MRASRQSRFGQLARESFVTSSQRAHDDRAQLGPESETSFDADDDGDGLFPHTVDYGRRQYMPAVRRDESVYLDPIGDSEYEDMIAAVRNDQHNQHELLDGAAEQNFSQRQFSQHHPFLAPYGSQMPFSGSYPPLPLRAYASEGRREEGLSALQMRLQAFQAAGAPPIAAIHMSRQPLQQRQLITSPTPAYAHTAQPSNLAPLAMPLHMEFTAPRDYMPVEMSRNGRSGQIKV